MMKKVCFVIPGAYYLFNPKIKKVKDNVGGTQTQGFIYSTELAKLNFDTHFCVADFGQKAFEIIKNVKLWRIHRNRDNIFKKVFSLFSTLKKINADIYIFQSADIGVAIAIIYLKFILNKKIIYMIASDIETNKKQMISHFGILSYLFMEIVYKYADTLTAQTNQQSTLFYKHKKRKPNAIIKNIYPVNNTSSISPSNKKTILWVGRLNKIKNPSFFLKLAIKFPEEHFIMIAPKARNQIKYGLRIEHQAQKIKNLTLIDFVPYTKIHTFYEQAKIYVTSSESEGFSNTMAEAMVNKCAILSYKVNTDNIITKYQMGYCANGDLNQFYVSFKKLLYEKQLLKMQQNAYNYLINYHNIEANLSKFIDLINDV